jgi:alpha-glucoside transport system substrate-binding protein
VRLHLILGAALMALLPGCAADGSGASVTVRGPWPGRCSTSGERALNAEAQQFCDVVARSGIPVSYEGTRALSTVLATEVDRGQAPDIAVLPSPGEIPRYAQRDLQNIGDVVAADRDRFIPGVVLFADWAVPLKANIKSLVWFAPGAPAPDPNGGWEGLAALTRDPGGTGRGRWCLGMGSAATSGWPGTDWIEDLVLHTHGSDLYERWARGEVAWTSGPIRQAWTDWAELVTGSAPGGADAAATRARALLTNFADARTAMVTTKVTPRCSYEHRAYAELTEADRFVDRLDYRPFPVLGRPPATGADALEVSADYAVLFSPDRPAARTLIGWLASKEGQAGWAHLGALSAHRGLDPGTDYEPGTVQDLATLLQRPGARCFDASDLMPPALRTTFYRGVIDFLGDPASLEPILQHLDEVRVAVNAEQGGTDRALGPQAPACGTRP